MCYRVCVWNFGFTTTGRNISNAISWCRDREKLYFPKTLTLWPSLLPSLPSCSLFLPLGNFLLFLCLSSGFDSSFYFFKERTWKNNFFFSVLEIPFHYKPWRIYFSSFLLFFCQQYGPPPVLQKPIRTPQVLLEGASRGTNHSQVRGVTKIKGG